MHVNGDINIVSDAVSVTPSDTTNLAKLTKGLFIGGAGNIAVVMESGSVITLTGVTAGTVYNLAVSRVNATNTTATNIIALY